MMVGYLIAWLIKLYTLIMIFWVVTSWFPRMRRNQIVRFIGTACEPPLRLANKVIPNMGGFDFSPIVVIVLLQVLARALMRAPF
jgi:YggT family protein